MKISFQPRFHRIYIVPTPFGLVYGTAVFLMLLMAYTYQNNLSYGLSFFLTGFGLTAMIATHRFLSTVEIEERPAPLVRVGQAFTPPVATPEIAAPAGALIFLPRKIKDLRSEGSVWSASERGVHALDVVEVRTTFPTGLFRAWKRVPVSLRVIAAPVGRDFGVRPSSLAEQDGDQGRKRGGDPRDLEELAPGRPEDPPSRIDWRSQARGRGLLRKEFDSAAASDLAFRWRDTEGLGGEENRLQQMAAWIDGVPSGVRWRAELPDGSSSDRVETVLTALARHGRGGTP